MIKGLKTFGKQYLFWFCFFELFKILFLLWNWGQTCALSVGEIGGVFWHGLRMDLSAAAYLTVLPALLLCAYPWWQQQIDCIIRWYTNVMVVALVLLGLSDMALYPEWQTRIGSQILPYMKEPQGVWQCMEWWQWLLALGAWLGLSWLGIAGWKRASRHSSNSRESRHSRHSRHSSHSNWATTIAQLLLAACLFLPIRGSLGKAPLNPSSVYFSENLYANYAALNYFWKFVYSLTVMDKNQCPVHYMSEAEARGIVESSKLKAERSSEDESLKSHLKQLPKDQKPNVVFILLESYAARCMGCYGATEDLTPHLSRWAQEGIQWDRFYASGNRSDRGFCALLAGYPALIGASSIMLFPEKMHDLKLLPQYFEEQGYQRSFYYGGDIEFYNTKALLLRAGVTQITERSDFPVKEQTRQQWGVTDGVLWKRVGDDILRMKEPFFCGSYNISTHPPYDIPEHGKWIQGTDDNSLFRNSVRYSDSCLNELLTRLKQSPLWDHTLVIITADHTCIYPLPLTPQDSPENYHIPMIWVGGMVEQPEHIEGICSQTDLEPTLAQQLGWKVTPSPFGKNMFGPEQYAFYFRDEYWGCITPQSAFSINMDTQQLTVHNGQQPSTGLLRWAEAWTQLLHTDFQKR